MKTWVLAIIALVNVILTTTRAQKINVNIKEAGGGGGGGGPLGDGGRGGDVNTNLVVGTGTSGGIVTNDEKKVETVKPNRRGSGRGSGRGGKSNNSDKGALLELISKGLIKH